MAKPLAGVVLLLLALARSSFADVYIMTPSYALDPLPDIPADFGPELPDPGIEGYLRSADPEDACSPLNFTDFQTPWIALIARQQQLHANNCTFDVKLPMFFKCPPPRLSPPYPETTRRLARLAGPLVIQNVAGYSLSLVSAVFVGHLNDPVALSAAVLAGSFYNITGFSLVIGLSAGMETLCGHS
ncbi:MATE efflux family protein DTX1 [Tetrabaena socialis]|uniref:MATE efflux family protein DTX1 n=1 Tax=Tetrabaena socialis TaxID=47790 RepID=A0A2J7ZTV4_9CHLO|nr:MATE efflux family protein DTX1 [Tetrabaena socialis]|eukprot:PNH03694.1 MATE efflux family protein DTX1 [Tetrabaena socialis]